MKARLLALYAIILALTFIAFLPFFVIAFLIPMIAVCATFKFRTGMFAAACAGVVSLIYAFSFGGGTVVAAGFQLMPWIPVVMRLLAGAGAWGAGHCARKLLGNRQNRFVSKILPVCVTATTASLLNSVLVVSALILFASSVLNTSGTVFVIGILPFAIAELIVNNIVTPPLSLALRRGLKGTAIESEIIPLNGVAVMVANRRVISQSEDTNDISD